MNKIIKYIPTIGLEVHAHLKTRTKMFCSCLNTFEEHHPNINVCPICLGHPGTLPTVNLEAVLAILKLGLALEGKIAIHSYFERKSYFYPDLPKGYQISQYEKPLIEGGQIEGIRIRRIHLEEDAGRLLHPNEREGKVSLVDFNRAGAPLMELVTEPDIKNAVEAVNFAKTLQLILRYLDVSNADMERGQMRVEANISLATGDGQMGTKVEVKNLNSFKAVHDAIEYELKRQASILERGEKIVQETRGWNEFKRITESQRGKEFAHDYRYFPEPDLPPLDFSKFDIEALKASLPELPKAKQARFEREYNLTSAQASILIADKAMAQYFEEAASELRAKMPEAGCQTLINYLTSDLRGLMAREGIDFNELKINPEEFAHLIFFIEKGELSSRLAKNLLQKMFASGEDPETILKTDGLKIMDVESELEAIVSEVLNQNPRVVADYKKGKLQALQFLIGQVIAKTEGRANPQKTRELLLKKLV
jgi:aspartyl-tRNA(Asn)/glutamyl-tRNA(Gln) amidotransferase subunit B